MTPKQSEALDLIMLNVRLVLFAIIAKTTFDVVVHLTITQCQ